MDTFKIKKGDTKPVIQATMQYSNGSAIDLNGVTESWFIMGNTDYSPYMSGNCVITGSSAGILEYRWQSGTTKKDTSTVGTYFGEFEVKWGTGSYLTLPNDHSLRIEVNEDYNE